MRTKAATTVVVVLAVALLLGGCRPLLNPWDPEGPNAGGAMFGLDYRYLQFADQTEVTGSVAPLDAVSVADVPANRQITVEFTISSVGPGDLVLSGDPTVALEGADAAYFVVTQPATTTVAGRGGTATFTIEAAPSGQVTRTVTVRIASNDYRSGEFVFDLSVTGSLADIIVKTDINPAARFLNYVIDSDYLYVAGDAGLIVFDISNPSVIDPLATLPLGGDGTSTVFFGADTCYLSDWGETYLVLQRLQGGSTGPKGERRESRNDPGRGLVLQRAGEEANDMIVERSMEAVGGHADDGGTTANRVVAGSGSPRVGRTWNQV